MKKRTCRVILLLMMGLIPAGLLSTGLFAQTNPGLENLKHKWTFNNGSTVDEVGQLEGILHGDASIVNDALYTTGNGWFEMPAEAIAVNTYPGLTQSVWVIASGKNDGYHPISWFGDEFSGYGINFLMIQNHLNFLRTSIYCLDSTSAWSSESGVNIPKIDEPKLHQIVTTIDDSTIKMYIDGILAGVDTLTEQNKLANLSNAHAFLAHNDFHWDPNWTGYICDYSLYNKALTDDEVLYLFQAKPETQAQLYTFTFAMAFDASYTQESFLITHSNLSEAISITTPDGISVNSHLISPDEAYSEITVTWDGVTPANGDIVLTSGSATERIEVITIPNNDCYVELPPGVVNLIGNSEINSFDGFDIPGPHSIVNVIDHPDDVYCGRTSAKVGNGVLSRSNSFDYYFGDKLKPNTNYTSKFVLKTMDGFVMTGVYGIETPYSHNYHKTFDTEGAWKEIVFHFKTGNNLRNPLIYINNLESTCKEYYVDNWQVYESYEAPSVQEDRLPAYVPKNGIHSYHSFEKDFPYDLFSLNHFYCERVEYTKNRLGKENAAIKLLTENQPLVSLFTSTLYEAFSFNTWVKPDREITLAEQGETSDVDSQNFLLYPHDGSSASLGIGLSVGNNGISVYGNSYGVLSCLQTYAAPINDFVNIAVNVTPYQLELYLNGELMVSTSLLYPTQYMSFESLNATSNFNGTIDELGIWWSRALTQQEIRKYYFETAPIEAYTNSNIIAGGRDFSIPILSIPFNNEYAVQSYQFDFAYDTTIVEYLGFDQANTLSENSTVLVNDTHKGLLKFGGMTQDFYQGDLPLIDLRFKAIKAGYFIPQISNFLFNADSVHHVFSDTIFVFTKYGDVDGNNYIQAYDASLVLKKSVGLDPLPDIDPLPWEGWRMVAADVDGDEAITAYDAALILKKSIDLLDIFPVENDNPTGMTRAAGLNFADISIHKEADNLVVRSIGNMLGLNMDVIQGNDYLAAPSFYAHDFINAENIQGGNYKIGLATATALEDNSILMIIPLKNEMPVEMSFRFWVNTTPKTITMLVPSGLSDELIPEIKVFPNPAKDKINIKLGMNPVERMRYKIIHLSGQTILEGALHNQTSVINLSNAAAGVYSIQILDKDKVVYLQKLIVK